MQEFQKRRRHAFKPVPDEGIEDKIREGTKFILVRGDYSGSHPGYELEDLELLGDGQVQRVLIARSSIYHLGKAGEKPAQEGLDELADLYEDMGRLEDSLIRSGKTNLCEAAFILKVIGKYETELINTLTRNGKDFDEDALEELGLNEPYVEEKMKEIASVMLGTGDAKKNTDLRSVLRHVAETDDIEELECMQKCYMGSHWEWKSSKIKVRRGSSGADSVYGCLDNISGYLQSMGKPAGRHHEEVIKEYINIAYIAGTNPEKMLQIIPPGRRK